jgi:hypothetical protein
MGSERLFRGQRLGPNCNYIKILNLSEFFSKITLLKREVAKKIALEHFLYIKSRDLNISRFGQLYAYQVSDKYTSLPFLLN